MSIVFKPHECEAPRDWNDGTVWKCDGCGKLRQVWFIFIMPVGPWKRWRLRRKGVLPIRPECDFCDRPSSPEFSSEDDNYCERHAPSSSVDEGNPDR